MLNPTLSRPKSQNIGYNDNQLLYISEHSKKSSADALLMSMIPPKQFADKPFCLSKIVMVLTILSPSQRKDMNSVSLLKNSVFITRLSSFLIIH